MLCARTQADAGLFLALLVFPCQTLNLEWCCCSKRIQKMFPAISQNKNRKFSSCHHFLKLQKVCNFDGYQFPHYTTFNHKYTSGALKVNKFLLNLFENGRNVSLLIFVTHPVSQLRLIYPKLKQCMSVPPFSKYFQGIRS